MTDTQSTDQKNDTGYVPGDDLFTRCRNYFVGITGGMTEEGIKQYRIDRDIRNEDKDCRRCEEQRDYILQYSPTVTFLNDSIRQLGGRSISRNNIHCRRCVTVRGGGFDPTFGMLICANNIKDPSVVEDTIAHEMVHAYDHLRFKADFENNLRHAACTEIRASSLSGECRWAREFFARKQWKLTQQHQECVRRRAVCSLIARPACKDEAHAERVVNEVWDSCFRDTRPFDEIFR